MSYPINITINLLIYGDFIRFSLPIFPEKYLINQRFIATSLIDIMIYVINFSSLHMTIFATNLIAFLDLIFCSDI